MRTPAPRTAITVGTVAFAAGLFDLSAYALLVMLPAVVLAWVVLIGWFTGERAIGFVRRIARRLRERRRVPGTGAIARPRTPAPAARGGLLLARRLASRPPPHLALS